MRLYSIYSHYPALMPSVLGVVGKGVPSSLGKKFLQKSSALFIVATSIVEALFKTLLLSNRLYIASNEMSSFHDKYVSGVCGAIISMRYVWILIKKTFNNKAVALFCRGRSRLGSTLGHVITSLVQLPLRKKEVCEGVAAPDISSLAT